MKKIIWVFGESGSGRKTLIENILNDKDNIKKELGLENENIMVAKETIEKHNKRIMDTQERTQRDKELLNSVEEFANSNNSILLVKGQYSDLEYNYDSVQNKISNNYPDIDKEFYLLEVKDLDLLYERMINQEWFKNSYEENIAKFPRSWISIAVKHLQNRMNECVEKGYQVTEIDTTDGYIIKNANNQKIKQTVKYIFNINKEEKDSIYNNKPQKKR